MTEAEDVTWDSRTLCPDESCIGTIGEDNRCRVCGRLYNPGSREADGTDPMSRAMGSESDQHLDSQDDIEGLSDHESSFGAEPEEKSTASESDESGTDWDNRKLCPDEGCIGVIGPGGFCKECGRPGEGSS